jgi:hypothetical protein
VPEGPLGPEATCINEGVPFRVTYPAAWFVHPQDSAIQVGACTSFGPEPFEHGAQERVGGGSSAWVTYLHGTCLAFEEIVEVLRVEETLVAGMTAYRIQSRIWDGPIHYMYVVNLTPANPVYGPDASCGTNPQTPDLQQGLLLATVEDAPGDFDVNRAVVDRMAKTLQVGD